MRPVHRTSHRRLLREFDAGEPRRIDAVIVPAGRGARHVRPAAQLASELGCPLVMMCSAGRADPREFSAIVDDEWPGLDWHPLNVPDDLRHPLLPDTARPRPDSRDWRHGALSTKRNLALLVARLVGWKTVFLVDDDIVDISADLVRDAASRLGPAAAVGLTVAGYPDNSVVCHANRLGGGEQDVFVGAAALVIDTTRRFGFFPNVYNEDWLFLYEDVAARRVGRLDGVTQLPYKPFLDASRAVAEEFGEIIAEGLMSSLHEDPDAGPPLDASYWNAFLIARRDFVAEVTHRLERSAATDREARSARRSLTTAENRRRDITAERCADYVRRWRDDLVVWRENVDALQQVADVRAAAEVLDLTDKVPDLTA